MFKYRFLDFPKIPQHLLDNIQPGKIIKEYPGRICTKNNKTFATSTGVYHHVNDELATWVNENILADIDFVGIRYQYGTPDTPSQGAHTDATRQYGLLYVVDNADGDLSFWHMERELVEIDRLVLVEDYNKLVKLESVPTPNGAWYLVNGQVLHSIENMTRTRVTVQVNLKSLKGLAI